MIKFVHRLKRVFGDKGILLTLLLTGTVTWMFFGKLIIHPGKTYYGAGGDGLQIYYETIYHIKYDHQYWHQQSVNYPYGESIFFTGAMPFVNNVAKIFGPDAWHFGIALINLLMIFSPMIGALFLYAIFRHLRLPWFYGAACASMIAFLSPQMARMGGHYSLQWVFLIPAMIFLLLRFYDYPSLRKSFVIAFLAFLGATTHLYFLAFFGIMGGAYWAFLFITRDRGFGRFKFALKHFTIQFILPVLLIQVITMLTDHVHDRTHAPWGFLTYHSTKSGVFWPWGRPYEPIFSKFFEEDKTTEFEGVAYIGLAAIAGLVTIFFVQLYRIFRQGLRPLLNFEPVSAEAKEPKNFLRVTGKFFEKLWQFIWLRIRLVFSVTDWKVLNILFWTSLVMLWFSFGNPFLEDHKEWVVYAGPLRQFRAIGRFTWVFYYIVNIIVVYRLYQIAAGHKWIRAAIMLALPLMITYDMYYNIIWKEEQFNNRIDELEDVTNRLPQDQWLQHFNAAGYQAILPLPYFHIGSENIARIPPDMEIVNVSYIVSLKTGLPLMATTSARTSISQSKNLVEVVLDPQRPLQAIKDLPDQRPLLLVVRPATLDTNEKRILALAKPVGTSRDYQIYSIEPAKIAALAKTQYEEVKSGAAASKKIPAGPFFCNDSNAVFVYRGYDNLPGKPYRGKGAFKGGMRDHNSLLDTTLRAPGDYMVSLWVRNVDKDLYPRPVIEASAVDDSGKVQASYVYFNVYFHLMAFDGEWGLVEFPFKVPASSCHVQINSWNYEMKRTDSLEVDDLLIRPANTDLYQVHGDTIIRNDQVYYPLK